MSKSATEISAADQQKFRADHPTIIQPPKALIMDTWITQG
jgi:hypothetical protein